MLTGGNSRLRLSHPTGHMTLVANWILARTCQQFHTPLHLIGSIAGMKILCNWWRKNDTMEANSLAMALGPRKWVGPGFGAVSLEDKGKSGRGMGPG